ncbi:MAG: flavodoxin family protein [Pseudomonadota bacterium]
MPTIEIIYFSGNGHTEKLAQAVAEGSNGRLWALSEDGELPDGAWDALDAADAIVFGSPTYMGGPAWQFKRFADASSKRWFARAWQDKFCGGFTVSSSTTGNKESVIDYFATLAAQHGMLWVSLGQAVAHETANTPEDRNWTGSSKGAMAIAPAESAPEDYPAGGDLISARDYGARVAQLASAAAYLASEAADRMAAE